MTALLLWPLAARAGTYTVAYTGGKIVTTGPNARTTNYSGTVTYGASDDVVVGATPATTALTTTGSGAITATFTWVVANGQTITTDPPPSAAIVEQDSTVQSYVNGSGVCNALATGLGLSDKTRGSLTQTTYTYKSSPGKSFSLTAPLCTPSIICTVPAGATNSAGGSFSALTGQQITGKFSLSGATITGYTWSVTGASGANPIKNWDPYAPNFIQLVPLTAADTTGTGSTVPDFSFYDQAKDTVTIQCVAALNFPDGTSQSVTIKSDPVTFLKPTATWGVDPATVPINGVQTPIGIGFHDDSATSQSYGVRTIWYPVKITVPSPFAGGQGCFAQIVTPTATIANASVSYSIKIQNASGKWVAPGTGLDQDFPYDFGYAVDANGNWTGQGPFSLRG